MENFEKLESLVQGAKEDAKKFYDRKNSAAGKRLRQYMQELKGIAQDIRNEVTQIKNSEKNG